MACVSPSARIAAAVIALGCGGPVVACDAQRTTTSSSDAPLDEGPPTSFPDARRAANLPLFFGPGAVSEPDTARIRLALTSGRLFLEGESEALLVLTDDEADSLGRAGFPTLDVVPLVRGQVVRPLYDKLLARARHGAPSVAVLLLADQRTPMRAVHELFFSAKSAGFDALRLGVALPLGQLGQLPFFFREAAGAVAASFEDPATGYVCRLRNDDLTVTTSPDGITIRSKDGTIAPGCQAYGHGVTVPNRGDQPDIRSLTDCIARYAKYHDTFDYAVGGAPPTPLQEVLALAAALETAVGTSHHVRTVVAREPPSAPEE